MRNSIFTKGPADVLVYATSENRHRQQTRPLRDNETPRRRLQTPLAAAHPHE
jgi:hypothetical protein